MQNINKTTLLIILWYIIANYEIGKENHISGVTDKKFRIVLWKSKTYVSFKNSLLC